MVLCAGAAGAARSDCGGSRWRLHSLRTSTRSFWTPPASLAVLPSLSLSTTTAKVRATLYSSRPERRMASPMRMRGGGADEIDCALEIGCAVVAGEDADALSGEADFARLRLSARFLVVFAADFLAAEVGRAAIVAAGAAAGADDFAARVEDDDAAMVVASPKSTANASLVASGAEGFTRGAAGFLRLRFRARGAFVRLRRNAVLDGWAVLAGRSGTACRAPTVELGERTVALDFLALLAALMGDAAGADAFRFSCMGVCGARRADDWRLRQARDVVESEDRAEKRVVMCGAEEFAAASRSCAGQPGWAARAERYDGDAVRRHGFE